MSQELSVRFADETLPNVQDIADRLPSRTYDRSDNLVGNFTEATNPTSAQVNRYILKAADEVYGRVGLPEKWTGVPASDLEEVRQTANRLVEIYTAMIIELGHYSEQVNTDTSPYKELKKLYDEGMAALIETLGGYGQSAVDEEISDETGGGRMGSWGFPETSIGDGVMP